MQITTRPFQDTDLGRCLEIERAAVRSNHYLNDVIDYYRTTKGEFTLALADSFPAGMGKLTVLYDGSAWLELLRVHPDFQRQGMGKAIYRRYLEQVATFGCPAARADAVTTCCISPCSSARIQVMIFVVLAIGRCSSPFFSKSTLPESPSISTADRA